MMFREKKLIFRRQGPESAKSESQSPVQAKLAEVKQNFQYLADEIRRVDKWYEGTVGMYVEAVLNLLSKRGWA